MKLNSGITVPQSPEQVWSLFNDPCFLPILKKALFVDMVVLKKVIAEHYPDPLIDRFFNLT